MNQNYARDVLDVSFSAAKFLTWMFALLIAAQIYEWVYGAGAVSAWLGGG